LNVDGASGAILADLGMKQAGFNGIFMIARTPGLIANAIEEQARERPLRRSYDGPPARSLTTNGYQWTRIR
jgi:citrate synthase